MQHGRPGRLNDYNHQYGRSGNKIRYKVPKTWRKTFSMILGVRKSNPTLWRRCLMYSTMITVGFFGVTFGFVKFLQMFGPGGSGRAWRQGIWNEVGGRDSNKDFEQMEQEARQGQQGYIQNMFGTLGIAPKMDTLDKRARENLSKEKYKTWSDVWNRGFPQSTEEYKRVSKMRPETMDDWELMESIKAKPGEPVSNAQLD